MSEMLYLGVKGSVVAIDKQSGRELWRSHLTGSRFTTLLVDDDIIIAHTGGHLYGLDPESGREIWHNKLPGLGYGLAALAMKGASGQDVLAQLQAQQAAAVSAAAAGAAVAASTSTAS